MAESQEVTALANMIYGEAAGEDYDTMKMVGSSAINRYLSPRDKEFGGTIDQVLQKGYYAVNHPNTPFKQAVSQKFPDKKSLEAYKRAYAIASGLIKGNIKRDNVHFYFTEDEIKKLEKAGKRKFDFKQVKETGKLKKYRLFSYPEKIPNKTQENNDAVVGISN